MELPARDYEVEIEKLKENYIQASCKMDAD